MLDMYNPSQEWGNHRRHQELGKDSYRYWGRDKSRVYSDLDRNNLSLVSDIHNRVKDKNIQSQELGRHRSRLLPV